ncbi:unnamed protein product [Rotaria sp. Silwood1]|nr:unnamed protein product [Rotaria sp. Silwood1]
MLESEELKVGQLVPIKAFHSRAQLVNVTAEVVLYQVYHNTDSIPIEAKYVFPFDENSSVCGFEVLINNIIIKCVVKEKEQTKREYREAIEKKNHAKITSWQSKQALEINDQTIISSINLEQGYASTKSIDFSLTATIRTPYEIKLYSPIH